MDVDIEMVSSRNDEVGPAEDLRETDIVDNPSVRRQNICFLVAMFACVSFFSVYVFGGIYMQPAAEKFPFGGDSVGDEGTVSNEDKLNKVSTAVGKYNNSHGKGWTNNHPDNHGIPLQKDHVDKVKIWQDATVTLDDGIKYEIVATLKHDPHAFLEGLCFGEGRLFESVGLNGQSDLRELDPATGEILQKQPISSKYFGEGLAYVKGQLIQLTWKSKKGFIYDVKDLSADPMEFDFSTTRNEGWGLTYDPANDELIESDGSSYLHFWDPTTMKEKRKVFVTRMDGTPAMQINELEFWRGRVIANLWFKDIIIVINPETGVVEKEYDLTQLWAKAVRKDEGADVLNGISISDDPEVLYITGKKWDRMFKLKLLV
mmetsp:Transcript_171/g.219  ORF Transcript_171/g.219 Transcript_171/m.219 type:complete len:373 (-) Transcript_171:421-1539(-)